MDDVDAPSIQNEIVRIFGSGLAARIGQLASKAPELTSKQREFLEKLLGSALEEAPEDGNGVVTLASGSFEPHTSGPATSATRRASPSSVTARATSRVTTDDVRVTPSA